MAESSEASKESGGTWFCEAFFARGAALTVHLRAQCAYNAFGGPENGGCLRENLIRTSGRFLGVLKPGASQENRWVSFKGRTACLTAQPLPRKRWRVAAITGVFNFKMKVKGEPRQAIIEITAPGIPSEMVVHVVRGEWANLIVPGVSQNRIECLGWDRAAAAPEGWRPLRAIGPNPIVIWRRPEER